MSYGREILFTEESPLDNDLAEALYPDESDGIQFGGSSAILGIESDPDLLDNSEPEFDDSNLDLGVMESLDMSQEEAPEELSDVKQIHDAFITHMSSNPNLVESLHKGVNTAKLDMIGQAINANLTALYKSDSMTNMLVNAVAQGMVVSEKFERSVPNTVKMYYVPSKKTNSIHLHKVAGSKISVYKATPALMAFDKVSLDTLSAMYRDSIRGFSTLSDYVEDCCYKPVQASKKTDIQAYLAMDNLTIAKNLSKSSISISAGIDRLKKIGCNDMRASKIAILAKALRDSN